MRLIVGIICIFGFVSCMGKPADEHSNAPKKQDNMENKNWNKLTQEEERIILHKGTEYPFTGQYNDNKDRGVYLCKQCNQTLFESDDKFNSGSGWPSFDQAIDGAVKEVLDADGRRSEIVCSNCLGHLGHVFRGEAMTNKNTRHCVNSLSLNFVPDESNQKKEEAYFGSGCFWGTEYFLQQVPGVISTTVGYMGGTVKNPSYKEVCTGKTGHAEVVKVVFDPDSISYEDLTKLFFETHDPTQVNRQGPDIGTQYRSEIFYSSQEQKKVAEELIQVLVNKGYKVATQVTPYAPFYKGEQYHQDYYQGNGGTPYCHSYQQKF